MSVIQCAQFTELDREIIDDFLECLQENVEAIEQCIEDLDARGSEAELINHLFRDVHSLKGNCRMVFLEPMVGAIHALEEIVSDMRQETRAYSPEYGEFIMAIVVRQRAAILELVAQSELDDSQLTLMNTLIAKVAGCDDSEANAVINAALDTLVGAAGEVAASVADVSDKQVATDITALSADAGEHEEDLGFFRQLAHQMDMLNPYHRGRSDYLLDLCLATNADLGAPADEVQLRAAVLMHDVGMAFVPAQIMAKPSPLDAVERQLMQQHVETAAKLLRRMPGWEDACEMVRQHHERYDGKGYPYGLRGDAIHPGAHIIALADTFFAVTHVRADRSTKKSLFGAMSLINGESGEQFDPRFVEAFNGTIRHLYVSNKQAS